MRWNELFNINLRSLSLLEGARAALVTFAPLLTLQAAGQTAQGLVIGIGALFASFTDVGPSYGARLRATALTAGASGLIFTVGALVGQSTWVSALAIFIAALFGELVSVYGPAAVIMGRSLALVSAVAFGLSLFNLPPMIGGFLLLGGLLTVLSVATLSVLVPIPQGQRQSGGPAPPRGLAPLTRQFTPRSPLLRYAVLRAAAAAAAASIAWNLLPRPYWSVIPIIVTLRPQQQESYRIIIQYLIGILIAAGAAYALSTTVPNPMPRVAIAFGLTFLAFSVRQINYGLFVSLLIAMILLIVTLLAPSPIPVSELRVIETLLGLGIASLATWAWGGRTAEPL